MNEKVQEFLATQKEKESSSRDELLIYNGLYEVQYDPEYTLKNKYPNAVYRTPGYATIPLKLTDEEFAQIKPYLTAPNNKASGNVENKTICLIAKVLAFILVVGGFVSEITHLRFIGFNVFLKECFVIAVAGTFLYLLAVLIKLLSRISNNLEKTHNRSL